MRRIYVALTLIVCIIIISSGHAQIPPGITPHDPSIPTPGVDGLRQEVEALRLEVNALNETARLMASAFQSAPGIDVLYLPSTGRIKEFTKTAWIGGVVGASDRGYEDITILVTNAQQVVDDWEAVKTYLESFTP